MIAPQSFRFEVDESGIATVTFDRPRVLNALTFACYEELRDLAHDAANEDSIKALILTGAGEAFCSGGDVHAIIGQLVKADDPEVRAFARLTCDTVLALRQLKKPVIAAVNGIAVGGGAALALAADLRVASTPARIGFLFPRVGLSGADMGVAWLLPRVVGLGRATEMLFTGDIIDADTALRWGLFNRVVAPETLLRETHALASRIAAGPRFALGVTKDALDRESGMTLEVALNAEADAQHQCMRTRDFREAYEAFVAKRAPKFD